MCQSGLIDRMSVNGGTRTAVSAKLIFSANANGMRKNTSRNSSGGRMMSHLPWRFEPLAARRAARRHGARPRLSADRINHAGCSLSVSPRKKKARVRGRGAPRAAPRRSRQRQRLIDACISALHIYGPSRTTVEKVVAIARMSPGIVRFYFDSKAAMLVASLQFLAAEFEEQAAGPVAELKSSPVAALELLVDLYLDPEIASPRKVSVWYAFWGEASSRQEYYDICGQKDESFAALVRELIGRLIDETAPAAPRSRWHRARPHRRAGDALAGFRVPDRRRHRSARRQAPLHGVSAFGVSRAVSLLPARPGDGGLGAAPAASGFAGWAYGDARALHWNATALFRRAWQIVGARIADLRARAIS